MKNPNGPSREDVECWQQELEDKEAERLLGAARGSVAAAGDVVMVGPYPDNLHECDECGALKPWIMMHDSKDSPLSEVCQKCHDEGH